MRKFKLIWNIKNNVGYDSEASLKDIEHYIPKKPLFTTEDGVDIFEGDEYYYFRKHSWTFDKAVGNQNFFNQDKHSNNSLYFSTKKAAEEYILMNRPLLSLKDIEGVMIDKYTLLTYAPVLKIIAKEKLNLK